MPLYFFDTRDEDNLSVDDIGTEFPDHEAVKIEAARALAELALDVIPCSTKRTLTIEVRDESGPVMHSRLHFEAVTLRPA